MSVIIDTLLYLWLNVHMYMYCQRRLEVWLDHVVAQRAARAACTGMSIISA